MGLLIRYYELLFVAFNIGSYGNVFSLANIIEGNDGILMKLFLKCRKKSNNYLKIIIISLHELLINENKKNIPKNYVLC